MPGFVRPATQGDLALIEQIETAADSLLVEWFDPGDWGPATTVSERTAWPGFILVSSESVNGVAVGFVHVIEGADFIHLEQLSVLPGHGRRGHGKALVEAAKDEARERGQYRMTLRTFTDVPWNAPFYAKCGFVESEPSTEFHRRLVQVELAVGLPLHGRRIEMTTQL